MSKKQCKRRVWQLINPIEYAIRGAALMPAEELTDLRIRELSSMECMVKGTAVLRDWIELAECINITQMMSDNGIGPEARECCNRAQEAMEEAYERFKRTGSMGLSGAGITAMREVLEYAALMQTSIPRSQFEQMIDKTRRTMKGHIGNQKGRNARSIPVS